MNIASRILRAKRVRDVPILWSISERNKLGLICRLQIVAKHVGGAGEETLTLQRWRQEWGNSRGEN